MKVLQINNFYNYGSTGKITRDLHMALLEQGQESLVCYGRGGLSREENTFKVCSELSSKCNNLYSRISGLMYGGLYPSTKKIQQIIVKEKPDVVHLQCLNCFFVNIFELIQWLKENRIKTILTLHAEFMYTANCGHAFECDGWQQGCGNCPRYRKETRSLFFDRTHVSFRKMQQAFRGFARDLTVVSVSPWLMDRARRSPILSDFSHLCIYNGIDTELFRPRDASNLRERHHLNHKKVILHVTAKFSDAPGHPKGGGYVLELAKKLPNVQFLVIGKHEIFGTLPDNVTLLGPILDQQRLAEYYSLADAYVLTSRRETFSMTCVESLCCGTPVFGFKAGAPEMISLPEYSFFFDQGDTEALAQALQEYCSAEPFHAMSICELARKQYAKDVMFENYFELYQKTAQLL